MVFCGSNIGRILYNLYSYDNKFNVIYSTQTVNYVNRGGKFHFIFYSIRLNKIYS